MSFAAIFAAMLWLKGNTHTHTLMSDGDSAPATVVQWYCDHGYDFLVITDHDLITRVPAPARMVLIDGEEVTDWLPKRPLHVNAIGLTKRVTPQHGETAVEVVQRNVDAIRKAEGIAAINHPNFGWALSAHELQQIEGATLLEIASGHPYVNMDGPPSMEAVWDELLTAGKRIWGIGVDDSHDLTRPWDVNIAPPGKAWIVVRAAAREREAILDAIRKGEFYASNGVELVAYEVSGGTIRVEVKEKNLAHYRIRFIGAGGRLLQESVGPKATYFIRGDEPYVRAKVIDSNGKSAWCQPVFPLASTAAGRVGAATPGQPVFEEQR